MGFNSVLKAIKLFEDCLSDDLMSCSAACFGDMILMFKSGRQTSVCNKGSVEFLKLY